MNELTRADITARTLFQAALPVPVRVVPQNPTLRRASEEGELLFRQIGCASCHIPALPLDRKGWIYPEPGPYNPPGNLQASDVQPIAMDLTSDELPQPRLKPVNSIVWVPLFTDFKLHDICRGPNDPNIEETSDNWHRHHFIEDETRTSVITIVSDAPKDSLDVDVIALGSGGEQLAKTMVSVRPHGQTTVSMADLLSRSAFPLPVYGSVSLVPHRPSTFAAQLSIRDRTIADRDDIEEEFAMLMDERPAVYRAVTELMHPLIAIRSLSTKSETLTIDCLGKFAGTQSASITPNQMLFVRPCASSMSMSASTVDSTAELPSAAPEEGAAPSATGISISSSAKASQLVIFGIGVVRGRRQQFGAIPFTDVGMLRSATEIFPGAAAVASTISGGALSLEASVANFGVEAGSASVFLNANGSRTVLKTVPLPPATVIKLQGIELPANTEGSLSIDFSGKPGDALGAISAVATAYGSGHVTLPWKDGKQLPNGGQHPWRTEGSSHSTLFLYNPDPDRANTAQLFLYDGQQEWAEKIKVAPLATTAVDINRIIREQRKDENGHVMRRLSKDGLVTWRTLSDPKLFGALVQYDAISKILRPYACAQTYALCAAQPEELTLLVSGSNNTYADLYSCGTNGDCDCYEMCSAGGVNGNVYNWYVADSSGVATLTSPPSYLYGQFKGNKPGNTYSAVDVTDNMGCSASGTGPINVVDIVVTNGGAQINRNQTAYISAAPQMPSIQAYLAGANSGTTVSWNMPVTYQPGDGVSYNGSFTGNTNGAATWTVPWSTRFRWRQCRRPGDV